MSQITTHILDTSEGKPARGVFAELYYLNKESYWESIANGVTNDEGRISDLLPYNEVLPKGTYKINFQTGDYFKNKNIKNFFPYVEIIFEIDSADHYHIPLLLSPFGYTTYRGS